MLLQKALHIKYEEKWVQYSISEREKCKKEKQYRMKKYVFTINHLTPMSNKHTQKGSDSRHFAVVQAHSAESTKNSFQ